MDDAQRVVVGTLGGGLMVGALAWTATVSITSTQPLGWRVLPPAGIFVGGAALFLWAWRGHNPRRVALDKAIADGHALLRFMSPQQMISSRSLTAQWEQWRDGTFEMLREHFGLGTAQDFQVAGRRGTHPALWVAQQVEFLEDLKRKRR